MGSGNPDTNINGGGSGGGGNRSAAQWNCVHSDGSTVINNNIHYHMYTSKIPTERGKTYTHIHDIHTYMTTRTHKYERTETRTVDTHQKGNVKGDRTSEYV